MTHAFEPSKLLARPEPHFEEGRGWPCAGWLGRVLWSGAAALLLAAFLAAVATDMVVQVPVTGVVAAVTPVRVDFVVTDRAEMMQVGLPVRIQDDENQIWATIVEVGEERRSADHSFARVTAVPIDASQARGFVSGQSCSARVLAGKIRTITGLWKLATNQVLAVERGEVEAMQAYVPGRTRGGG